MEPNSQASEDQPTEVQIAFTMKLEHGELEATATVPTARVTLTQLMPVLQGITSSIVAAAEVQVREAGKTVSCKAGCAACCYQLVPLSLFEAEALAGWIRSLPQEQQDVLQARFHSALQQLSEKGFLEMMDPAKTSGQTEEEHQKFLLEYLRLGVACPFLQDAMMCSIHPIRPACVPASTL